MRHLRIALATLLFAAFTLPLLGAPAHAAAYRYWGFYEWTGTEWAFATTGPAQATPKDGAVDGWRFAVSDEASTRVPRADGDFDAICATTPAEEGRKRVAVVIDYGTPKDVPAGQSAAIPEPRGACASVPEAATSQDVLAAVAELRTGKGGLICALDGWPAKGCGEAVKGAAPKGAEQPVQLVLPDAATATETASPAATDDTTGTAGTADGAADDAAATADEGSTLGTLGLVAAIAALLVVGVAALARSRRSTEAGPPNA